MCYNIKNLYKIFFRRDNKGKKWAEGFSVYFNLNKYISKAKLNTESEDTLFYDEEKKSPEICTVFSGKTQGYPYHLHVLAVACLFESRLEGAALVRGDISIEQTQEAVKWANSILDEPITIPICVDNNRLIKKIKEKYDGVQAIKVYSHHIIEETTYFSKFLFKSFSLYDIKNWFKEELKNYSSPSQLGVIKMFI